MNFLPFGLAALITAPAIASDWQLDSDASSIEIITEAFGREVTGSFSNFEADIRFDPDDLAEARIEGRVAVDSGETGNPQYDAEMTGDDGLDAEHHPFAVFSSEIVSVSSDCSDGDGECYRANGTLTLRGNSQPAELLFRLSIEGDRAVADGELAIVSDEFGIGNSNWGGSASTVDVRLHIEATR
ncbi:YceI family protein [Hyphobacterium sp.]|jgi:polyisoprenoid-binding protein YceI|uniref:YceI family protein n=1 Tax=Hyphobacterium sp. TaxID=2004662 RepID=UPI003BA857FA